MIDDWKDALQEIMNRNTYEGSWNWDNIYVDNKTIKKLEDDNEDKALKFTQWLHWDNDVWLWDCVGSLCLVEYTIPFRNEKNDLEGSSVKQWMFKPLSYGIMFEVSKLTDELPDDSDISKMIRLIDGNFGDFLTTLKIKSGFTF